MHVEHQVHQRAGAHAYRLQHARLVSRHLLRRGLDEISFHSLRLEVVHLCPPPRPERIDQRVLSRRALMVCVRERAEVRSHNAGLLINYSYWSSAKNVVGGSQSGNCRGTLWGGAEEERLRVCADDSREKGFVCVHGHHVLSLQLDLLGLELSLSALASDLCVTDVSNAHFFLKS